MNLGILSRLFGLRDPISSMNLSELRETEIQLTHKVEELQEEIRQIEKDIQVNFDRAKKTTSRAEEVTFARRIKTLSQKKEMKLHAQSQREKELRAISNIIILKEDERDVPSDVLDRLKRIDPERLEHWLISQNLRTQSREEQVSSIIDLTSEAMKIGAEEEEDLTEILDAIRMGKEQRVAPRDEEARGKRTEYEKEKNSSHLRKDEQFE